MPKYSLRSSVDTWMSQSFMDPWLRYVAAKESRGELVSVGNVKVDAVNMFQRPFRCDSHVCSPGLRGRGKQSCCGELEAAVTPQEMKGIAKHFDAIDAYLKAHDPSWARRPLRFEQVTEVKEDFSLQLKKRNGRCTMSWLGPDGEILCGVHSACMEHGLDIFKVKPRLCSIFPLLMQDLLDDCFLLSRLDEENGCLVGFTSYQELPCLQAEKTFGPDVTPAYLDFLGTLTAVFGAPFVHDLDAAARTWRKQQGLPKLPAARLPVLR